MCLLRRLYSGSVYSNPCADPGGGHGVRTPIKSQKYTVSYTHATSRLAKGYIVHDLGFGDIAVMQIETICSRVTGLLIGSLGCLKKGKNDGHDTSTM